MARTQANIYLTIWADPDFRRLSPDAQWLYFVMLTHESLNYCGVMDWRPARLAAMSAGMTVQRVEQAAWELGCGRFIAVDEHTEEAVVRSFVRHDGVLKQPNTTKGLVREYGGIASLLIMEIVAREVRRALEENPDWKGAETASPVSKQFPEPFDLGSWNPSIWVPKRFDLGYRNPSDLVPFRLPEPFDLGSKKVPFLVPPKTGNPSILYPSTSTSTSTSSKEEIVVTNNDNNDEEPPLPKIRLPKSWAPTAEHIQRASQAGLNITEQVEAFRNHAETHDRHAARWNSAFTTWLKKASQYSPPRTTVEHPRLPLASELDD